MINYRSIEDLNSAILRNLHIIPRDIEFVVGIPRSGMLPANLISLYLNRPYTDIDSFLKGRVLGHGERKILNKESNSQRILIVDDSICTGNSLQRTKEKLKKIKSDYEYIFMAIFAMPESTSKVDLYCEIVPSPRVFQWNLFHHPSFIPHSCFDIDGVLCEDPKIDDDGPLYMEYIASAAPKFIPTYEIDTIVTCRLEKYRSVTETWLNKNGVKYKRLIMLNMKTKKERLAWGKHGEYKGKVYKEVLNSELFVESSLREAKQIVAISKKPVFCTENFTLLNFEKDGKIFDRLSNKIHIFLWHWKMRIQKRGVKSL